MSNIPPSYLAFIEKRAGILLEEHRRWGESLFKLLVALNTGGVAISLGVINAHHEKSDALVYLKVAITCFMIGAILSLIALRHEFTDAGKLLNNWNSKVKAYYAAFDEDKEAKWTELIESDASMCKQDRWDLVIGHAPGITSSIGIIIGILAVWCT